MISQPRKGVFAPKMDRNSPSWEEEPRFSTAGSPFQGIFLTKSNSDPHAQQLLPDTTSLQPTLLGKIHPGSEPPLFSRGNIWQLSCLACSVFPKNLRGFSMAPMMTRGVTGQRDKEHFRFFFASDLCQKAKKVLLEIPGAPPVLCCQVGFSWGHSCLFTGIASFPLQMF